MIYPTDEQLLGGIAKALEDTVLPDLARGTAARKQLQAAIESLRRMAFAAPGRNAALAADNEDMAGVLVRINGILSPAFTLSSPLPSRERDIKRKALPLDGGGLGGGDAAAANQTLQLALTELQDRLSALPPDLNAQITPLLSSLYKRMTDRALALIPPPMPRTPRKSA